VQDSVGIKRAEGTEPSGSVTLFYRLNVFVFIVSFNSTCNILVRDMEILTIFLHHPKWLVYWCFILTGYPTPLPPVPLLLGDLQFLGGM
jgi:hypothetical protein